MTNDSPQVAALRQRYRKSFSDKAAVVAEFHQSLSDDSSAFCLSLLNEDSETVSDYLHKLAGSAGMYEYDDIAALARKGMSQCKQEDVQGLLASLSQLRDLLDQYA